MVANALMRGYDEHAHRIANDAAAMKERHNPVRERLIDDVFDRTPASPSVTEAGDGTSRLNG